MTIYEELGLTPLVNSAGTYTIIGGSKMSPQSIQAMGEAAASQVEIRILQEKVHQKLAELTQNESAVVTAGAIVGVYLSMASCISKKYNKAFKYLRPEQIAKSEILMFRAHRNSYDRGIALTGAKLVELGFPNNIDTISAEAVEEAITENTVGMLYLPTTNGGWVPPGALDLESTVALCQKHNIPLIIDAAAQLPPKSNLWHFTKDLGATAVIFSGGKYLKGPQTTGLVLGEKSLLDWIVKNNFPNYDLGRMHKVGREELAGIYSAVKEYLAEDEDARLKEAEEMVEAFVDAFSTEDDFSFQRAFPNEAGQPMARAKLILQKGQDPHEICAKLKAEPRSIFTMVENGDLYINPMMMCREEGDYVLSVFRKFNQSEI